MGRRASNRINHVRDSSRDWREAGKTTVKQALGARKEASGQLGEVEAERGALRGARVVAALAGRSEELQATLY